LVVLPREAENVPTEKRGTFGYGDCWTWTGIDADTKLIISYLLADRGGASARHFIGDLASRIDTRIQLTTDGHKVYLEAVEGAFGGDIDYAMLVKIYGREVDPGAARYSPAVCTDCKKEAIIGDPDPDHVSTSYVERQNLTMRMGMRRFTRLTNGFSKKVENLGHAVALHFMHYNFVRRHMTLKATPAQAAGIADHQWSIEELVGLLDPLP
jgi:IS1 family transposase